PNRDNVSVNVKCSFSGLAGFLFSVFQYSDVHCLHSEALFFFFSLCAFRMVFLHFLCHTVICFSAGGRGTAVQLHGRFRVCVVTLRPLAHPSAFDVGSSTQLCNLTALLMCSPAPPPRFLGAAGRCSHSTRTPVCRAASLRVGRPWVGP
ncbi:unnamed protein product, partial [Ixodes persulcatus]